MPTRTIRIALSCMGLAVLAGCQTMTPRTPVMPVVGGTQPGPDIGGRDANPLRENILAVVADTGQLATRYNGIDFRLPAADDLWQQMRSGFAMPGCDYAPRIDYWIGRYAASPQRFASTLSEMLPALDYTHRQIQAAGLPSEFALLPIVESHYRPYPGADNRPAGIWQMVGSTARSAGLQVDSWVDGRLNLVASTDAAIALLDRYGDHFNGDWRLVAFAYNAGEFRVKKALEQHEPDDDFASLSGLGLANTSYEYLTKLLALSCMIREPERYDLELPVLADERRLEPVTLDGVVGETLARALSGLPEDKFKRYNGGLLRGRTPADASYPLLVPADDVDRVANVVAELPDQHRTGWHHRRLTADESIDELAHRNDLPVHIVYAINNHDPDDDQHLVGNQPLWLPGRVEAAPAPAVAVAVATADTGDGHYVVRRGDSLWAIARRHGLTVNQLLGYNGLTHSRLQPGQRLRLSPP